MTVFIQSFNAMSNQYDWVQRNDYDYMQDIARSAYADMLHDKERNQKYYAAIKKAVAEMKGQNRAAKVLDIGTGSGILSMMAARCGADSVTACETFRPVADCANRVIKANGLEDQILVLAKRSTEISVGEDCNMDEKANILVTEIFDTELIGEGALSTFKHALAQLLEPDSIVIPSSATVYAQVVDSKKMGKFNKFYEIQVDEQNSVLPPPQIENCPGIVSVHDIQMMQLEPERDFVSLTPPQKVFEFDFTGKVQLKLEDSSVTEHAALAEGEGNVVFMWWDLKMDMTGEIILSCAPKWAHPEPNNMQWRDHWMQAVYYLPERFKISKGETFFLKSNHDEYNIWFNAAKSKSAFETENPDPDCTCIAHCANSRTRIGMMNDNYRIQKYTEILRKYTTPESAVLCIGDGTLLSLISMKLGAKSVYAAENMPIHQNRIHSYMKFNDKDSIIKLIGAPYDRLFSRDFDNKKIDLLIAEPFFHNSLLPWDSFYFLHLVNSKLSQFLSDSATVSPQKIVIRAVAMEFENLQKIRDPIVEAEGFDFSYFDSVVQRAIDLSDAVVEPHPLWEYRGKPLSNAFDIFTFTSPTFANTEPLETSGVEKFIRKGCWNGVALWVDYHTDDIVVTTGPKNEINPDEQIEWDMYTRQGVYFVRPFKNIEIETDFTYSAGFDLEDGHLSIDFS